MGHIALGVLLVFCFTEAKAQTSDPSFYLLEDIPVDDLSDVERQLIDSVLKLYHQTAEDTLKLELINHIVEESWDDRVWPAYNTWMYDQINERLKDDLSVLEIRYYKSAKARAINNIGFLHSNSGVSDSAIYYYQQSLKIQQEIGDQFGEATSLNNIGYNYDIKGQLSLALDYYLQALRIREKIGHNELISSSLNNVAVLYWEQGQTEEALNYFMRNLKMEEERKDYRAMAISHNNIGSLYHGRKKYDQTLFHYSESKKYYEMVPDKEGIATSLDKLGTLYADQKEVDKALTYFEQSLAIRKEINDTAGTSVALKNMGSIYVGKGQWAKAKKIAYKGHRISVKSGYPRDISATAELVYGIEKQHRNWRTALEMLELHIRMKDTIENEENKRNALKQQFQYEYQRKSIEDSILQADELRVKNAQVEAAEEKAARQRLELDQEQKQRWFLYGGLGLVALFGLFMFNRFRVTQRQKKVIEEQKKSVETQKNKIEEQHHQLEETHRDISDSINYAQRLQTAILPRTEALKEYLKDGFVLFRPKDVVSGDFYWMQTIDDLVFFAVADCTGHGVPGAMVSVVCSNALNRSVKEFGLREPADILNKTRALVVETFSEHGTEVQDGMDIALCKLENDQLTFAGAYNPLWIIREGGTSSSTFEEYKGDKQPIGAYSGMKPFEQHVIKVEKGDQVYLFTDGFADQFGGPKGKKFKYKPFKQLLLNIAKEDMDEQKRIIEETFVNWKASLEQIDDVCIIGVRF